MATTKKPEMSADSRRKTLGKLGEDAAAARLEAEGVRILARNFRCRTGEIDIIGQVGATMIFVEVKSKHSDRWGLPAESVNYAKQQKIRKAAAYYLYQRGKTGCACRFDVVSILYSQAGQITQFDWITNAF